MTTRPTPLGASTIATPLGAVVTFRIDDALIPHPRAELPAHTPRATTAVVVEVERRPGSVLMIRHHEVGSARELAALIQAASEAVGTLSSVLRPGGRSTNWLMTDDSVPERRFLRALGSRLRPSTFALVVLCSSTDAAALHRVMSRTHPDVPRAALDVTDQKDAVAALRTGGLTALSTIADRPSSPRRAVSLGANGNARSGPRSARG